MILINNKWEMGTVVIDENGAIGVVGIKYNDDCFITDEDDVDHPNPRAVQIPESMSRD